MKTAFTSKRIGVTAAVLLLSGLLVGANAGAANAYTYNPSLSVSTTALQPGDVLHVQVNDAPSTFTVSFNGVDSSSVQPNFEAPSTIGTYELVLKVSGTVVDQVAITEGVVLASISLNHGTITANRAFAVTGDVVPATGGVPVTLFGEGVTGGYKVLGHGTTTTAGSYSIPGVFTGTGTHRLRVVTTANAMSNSVTATSTAFTVLRAPAATKLKSISLNHGTITHNKPFTVTGRISPAARVNITLEGEGGHGGYRVLAHGTSAADGTYSITATFTGTGQHYLKVITTANSAYTSVTGKSKSFIVK